MTRDRFFEQKTCDRCGVTLFGRIQSRFNDDVICRHCDDDERAAPGFEAALYAEVESVKSGNLNFVGVGLSHADREFLSARRAARKETKP